MNKKNNNYKINPPAEIEGKDSATKTALSMIFLYFILWGTQFIGVNFIPIFINNLSFTNSMTVGIIVALGSMVTIVAQPIWGIVADRAKTKNRIIAIVVVILSLSIWLLILPSHQSMLTLVPSIIVIFSVLYIPQALTDTVVVENISRVRVRFGLVKCFSSGGAAAMAFLLFLLGRKSDITSQTAFVMLSIAAALSLVPLFFMPSTKGHAREGRNKVNLKVLLQNRRLVLLLSFGLAQAICVSCGNTFLSVYFTSEQGMNASIGLYGLFYAISITAEALLMLLGAKILSKINVYTIFLIAPFAGVFRALVIFFSPNPYIMMTCAIFHSFMFGPLWVRLAPYIRDIVPEEMRATGQSVWSIMFSGLGTVIGSLFGGVVVNIVGLHNLFLVIACMLFVVFVVFFFLFRRQRAIDLAEGFSAES